MRWEEPDPSRPNLRKLLNFLTAITKQTKLAHVVLASSDYFLASWLFDRKFSASIFLYSLPAYKNRAVDCFHLIRYCRWIDQRQVQSRGPWRSD